MFRSGFVGHFFFRSSNKTKMKAQDPFRSFISQMIAYLDMLRQPCPYEIQAAITRYFGHRSTVPVFEEVFRDIFLPLHKHFVEHIHDTSATYVIDGLDECERAEWQPVLRACRLLLQKGDARVFISGREDLDVSNPELHLYRINIMEKDVRNDIRTFVDWKMGEKNRDNGQLSTNEALVSDISNTLNDKAHLM